jgi:hypothetical protein
MSHRESLTRLAVALCKKESMKTRILHTKFWKDRFITNLEPLERLVFNYLITNEYVNIIHIYECPDGQILLDTGVERGVLESCKKKFEQAKKIYFKNGWVCLSNACKYETYAGIDNEACKVSLLYEMGRETADYFNTRLYTPLYSDYNTEIRNKKLEMINKKSKSRKQKLEDINKFKKEF